jgi:DNA-binding CsgD family transcriptional regulator
MFDKYLTERERKILYLYYGLDDGEERTLEEIGSLLGVTRERIRQIRNRAFEKLRESTDGEALATFWAPTRPPERPRRDVIESGGPVRYARLPWGRGAPPVTATVQPASTSSSSASPPRRAAVPFRFRPAPSPA